jgi:hypothetical protein
VITLVLVFAPLDLALVHPRDVFETVLTLLLVYSVAMVADAVCELFDKRAPRSSNLVTRLLLPVEPRGIASLVTLASLVAVFSLAVWVRGHGWIITP